MRSHGSCCALTAMLLLAGAGFFGLASTAPAQSNAFRNGVASSVHNVVDLVDLAAAEGRPRPDVKHLRIALNKLLHVMEKSGHGKKGAMGKGVASNSFVPYSGNNNAWNNGGIANVDARVNVNVMNNGKGKGAQNNVNNAKGKGANHAIPNNGAFNNGMNNAANPRAFNGPMNQGPANNANINVGGNARNVPANNRPLNNVPAINAKANAVNNGPTTNRCQGAGGVRVSVNVRVGVGAAPGSGARASTHVTVNTGSAKNGNSINSSAVRNVGIHGSVNNTGNAKNQSAPANNLAKSFPNLGNYKVLDASNKSYNCISHTLGVHHHWINPRTGPANAPLAPMDQLYNANGFQRQPNVDLRPDPNLQKVAVYATKYPDGSIKKVTHAALQQPNGTWTSKLGQLPLVQHQSPWSVSGPTYGVPVATYVRPVAGNTVGQRAMNNAVANRKR